MNSDNLLAGALGFFLGRSTAPAPPPRADFWGNSGGLTGLDCLAREIAERGEAARQLQEKDENFITVRARRWERYNPLTVSLAQNQNGIPLYPRFARQWHHGYREDHLYYLEAGETGYFPQFLDVPPAERAGPGWVMVRDEPGWDWSSSDVLDATQVFELAVHTPLAWGLEPETRVQLPWGKGDPYPMEARELSPTGWWDGLGKDDPRYRLSSLLLIQHGFMDRTM